MKKMLLALCAPALLLAACNTGGISSAGSILPQSPAPLATTTVDDTALETAWKGFDLALDAIDLIPASKLPPGSDKAKAVAKAIRTVSAALTSAEHFAAAGSTTSYLQALQEAKAGLTELRTIIKG